MKPINYKDTALLARLPVGRWIAAGAYSVHGAKMNRLVRLGVLKRRVCPAGLTVSRTWDYMRER
jgi:hypothetical protein